MNSTMSIADPFPKTKNRNSFRNRTKSMDSDSFHHRNCRWRSRKIPENLSAIPRILNIYCVPLNFQDQSSYIEHMTLQQLRYAIGIAESPSVNKAAEKLYISQPSLTAAIHELEDELGITIFNRTSRGVSLTRRGRVYRLRKRPLPALRIPVGTLRQERQASQEIFRFHAALFVCGKKLRRNGQEISRRRIRL